MRRFSFHSCWLMLLSAMIPVWGAEAPAKFTVGEFGFKPPAGWGWVVVNSPMRKAEMKVGEGEAAAEVIFYHFGPGNGGGTQANVDRWLGQFKEPKAEIKAKVEEVKMGNRQATFVQGEGTYMSGRPGGPKTPQPNSMLVGVVMESQQGSVFIRMVGPKPTVEKARESLRHMVEAGLKGE